MVVVLIVIFTSSLGSCYFLSASKLACCFFAYTSGYGADVLLLGILDSDAGSSILTSCVSINYSSWSSLKATLFDLTTGTYALDSYSSSGFWTVSLASGLLRLFLIQVEFGGGD